MNNLKTKRNNIKQTHKIKLYLLIKRVIGNSWNSNFLDDLTHFKWNRSFISSVMLCRICLVGITHRCAHSTKRMRVCFAKGCAYTAEASKSNHSTIEFSGINAHVWNPIKSTFLQIVFHIFWFDQKTFVAKSFYVQYIYEMFEIVFFLRQFHKDKSKKSEKSEKKTWNRKQNEKQKKLQQTRIDKTEK